LKIKITFHNGEIFIFCYIGPLAN